MSRHCALVIGVIVSVLGEVGVAVGQGHGNESSSPHAVRARHTAAAVSGVISGAVTDAVGSPLDGVMVSAFGPSGAELALSDRAGRFTLSSLAPGAYHIQAHLAGFASSPSQIVSVSAGMQAVHAITLSPVAASASVQALSAELGVPRIGPVTREQTDTGGSPAVASVPHDHGEKAWRLRRLRRSVLKETATRLVGDAAEPASFQPGRVFADAGGGASVLRGFPVRGEVNLLTRGTVPSSNSLSEVTRPGGIANLSVGAPLWLGDWTAQGAMTTGDVMTWVVSGSYVADEAADSAHQVSLDVGYGRQHYRGANPAAMTVAPETRYAASFGASDRWKVSPWLTLDYGGRYATYGYVEEEGLFSPHAAVTLTPVSGFRMRFTGAQEKVAPGAEEFSPRVSTGLWLPPERTFAAFSSTRELHPERTRHLEVGFEQDIAENYVVGVSRFYQDVTDQMATLFGVDEYGNAPTGHYYLARAGSYTSRGWILTLRRQLGRRVSGSVDVTIADAQWVQAGADAALGDVVVGAIRPTVEAFHDVSGTVETEFPETATRVFVRVRVNDAFVQTGSDDQAIGLDTRFDVVVHQALPFSLLDGSQWAAMIAVRSLFFDPRRTASMFDELFVVRPPKQVVGGLVVHF